MVNNGRMAAYTVTANTSVLLISTLQSTNIVYLSSVGYPGHIVTIKDTTGLVSQGNPVVVSTLKGVSFADGSFSTVMLNPYSFVTAASKTPNTWQLLNNVGFLTTLSNAYIHELTTGSAFINVMNSLQENVSSSVIGRINVTDSLTLLGDATILGNITVVGVVDLFSTLDVKENISFSSMLTVRGAVGLGSTLTVNGPVTAFASVSTLHNIDISSSLIIDNSLFVYGALVPRYLSVQTLVMNTVNSSNGLRVAKGINVGSNAYIGESVRSLSTFLTQSSLTVQQSTFIDNDLTVQKSFQTDVLNVYSSGVVTKEASVSSLFVQGTLSTGDSLFVKGTLDARGRTNVNNVIVSGKVTTNSLFVTGNAFISSIILSGEIKVKESVNLYSTLYTSTLQGKSTDIEESLYVKDHTSVSTILSTTNTFTGSKDLYIGNTLTVKGNSYVGENVTVNSVYRQSNTFSTGNLYVQGNLTVLNDFSIPGIATAQTLAAPINIVIDTLLLSNTMNVFDRASIPFLESKTTLSNPYTILAGENLVNSGYSNFLDANPTANIRNLLQSQNGPSFSTQISSLRISTLSDSQLLGLFLIGSSNYSNPFGGKAFTANVESRFEIAMSTINLIVSTVNASSIEAAYFIGDASQLSNANSFRDKIGTSSIITNFFNVAGILDCYTSTSISTVAIESQGILYNTDFLSTTNTWIAAGLNFLPQGNIQYTQTINNWLEASNINFQYYGTGIFGNSNTFFPLFVATGADSITENTIQYSSDAHIWYPVESGGFDTEDENGFKSGTTVAYLSSISFQNRWIVGGKAASAASTIQYSDDGSNFYSASNLEQFSNVMSNSILKIKAANSVAVALTDSNALLWSSNAIDWSVSVNASNFTTYGYGYTPTYNFAWYAIDTSSYVWFSVDNGSNWQFNGSFTGIFNAKDVIYNAEDTSGYWLAATPASLYSSTDFLTWTTVGGFSGVLIQSIYWNKGDSRWFLGGQSSNTLETLWTSVDGTFWNSITSGGFSTGIESYGIGRAILVTPSTILAGGTGSFTGITENKGQILQVLGAEFPPSPSGAYTSTILTRTNASNVFLSNVYGLGYVSTLEYPYIAVGDGITPQKTIARSSNLVNWIPAVVGGFSTAYGVIYHSTTQLWYAVGTAIASTATIQYSQDGASWYPTNFSGLSNFGGRGITKLRDIHPTKPNRLVAIGAGNTDQTMLYSDDGNIWSVADNGFRSIGYAVAPGIVTYGPPFEGIIAVGAPISSNNPETSILHSEDGKVWTSASSGGFEVAGYGIGFGKDEFGSDLWVAVGENLSPGDTTIQYSGDGYQWSNASNAFNFAGYGVTYNAASNIWIAVGKDIINTYTIRYSYNGTDWGNILSSNESGFLSQQTVGSANSVYGQQVTRFERLPYITMPKLQIYERFEPINYTNPTIRLLSTALILNEALTVNMSSQVILNSNAPYDSNTTVTVQGSIDTFDFYYTGTEPTYRNMNVNSLTVSTLQFTRKMLGESLEMPSLEIMFSTLANTINIFQDNTDIYTNVNNTLFVKENLLQLKAAQRVGINTVSQPVLIVTNNSLGAELDVGGIVGCSTISTSIYKQSPLHFSLPNQEYIQTPNLSIFENQQILSKNTIYSQPSTITFNSILTVNLSTQRVGCFTSNPLFDFDMRRAGWISNLTTQTVKTETLFFTLQSI